MREISPSANSGIVITAPEAISYVFGRNRFSVKHAGASYISAQFYIYNQFGQLLGSEQREVYGTMLYADLERYFQIEFRNAKMAPGDYESEYIYSSMQQTFSVTISVQCSLRDGTEEIANGISVKVDGVFGQLGARESSAGPKNLVRYVNLPQTFDLFAGSDTWFSIGGHGAPIEQIQIPNSSVGTASGYRLVSLNLQGHGTSGGAASSIVRNTAEKVGATLKSPTNILGYYFSVSAETCGVYLRWLDRSGRWQYFLFREESSEYDVSTLEEWAPADLPDPSEYIDGLNDAIRVRRSYERTHVRKLTARLIEEGFRDLLQSLSMSVAVDVYDGESSTGEHLWHRVLLKGGKFSKSYDPLFSYSVEIEEPVEFSQNS